MFGNGCAKRLAPAVENGPFAFHSPTLPSFSHHHPFLTPSFAVTTHTHKHIFYTSSERIRAYRTALNRKSKKEQEHHMKENHNAAKTFHRARKKEQKRKPKTCTTALLNTHTRPVRTRMRDTGAGGAASKIDVGRTRVATTRPKHQGHIARCGWSVGLTWESAVQFHACSKYIDHHLIVSKNISERTEKART